MGARRAEKYRRQHHRQRDEPVSDPIRFHGNPPFHRDDLTVPASFTPAGRYLFPFDRHLIADGHGWQARISHQGS
jgi:hypothetical protein